MTEKKKVCDYCDKRGVPILPLRYAVVRAAAGLPAATGPEIQLDSKAAYYTRRLLRAGYLYVFDEARQRWDDYYVTPDGYFFRIYGTPGVPPVLPQKPFNCPDLGHAAVASCITIPDAKRATKVWLGFSDVQWTAKVRQQHQSASYRELHMRCVDVKAYAQSVDKTHCLPIDAVDDGVAEYKFSKAELDRRLAASPFTPVSRFGAAQHLVTQAQRLAPNQGFAVVLSDPVGIAAELGAVMNHELDAFVSRKGHRRELAASTAIIQMEAAVREQARLIEERAAKDLADDQMSLNPLGHALSERTRQRTEELRTVTPAQAKRAEENAWAKYRVKFDEAGAKSWRQSFDAKLKEFDAERIAPLARAHAAWMRHSRMARAFECNFDATDAECGVAYAKTLQLCIGSTQDKAACFDLYTEWWGGSLTDKANLLLRAMVLNLDATAKEVQSAATVNLDWRGFPLDQLAGNFGEATERAAAGRADAVGRLVQMVGGPLAKWLATAVDGKVRAGMAALGLNTGMGFVVVEVTGSKKKFRAQLIRALLTASGASVNEKQMRDAVAAQMKRLEVAGVPLEGTDKKRFLMMVDPQASAGMPQGTSAQRAAWLADTIRTPEQFEEVAKTQWRVRLSNPGAGAAVLRGGLPFVAGLVGGILQYHAMQKMAEDDGKAMTNDAKEALWRLRAGVLAFGGTLTELAGIGAEKIAVMVPRFGRGLSVVAKGVGWGGRLAGLAGALIMAWMDVEKALEARAEGQQGLKWAYLGSAAVGVAAAAAILFSWTGVGLILVAVLIGITVLIEHFKDNTLQNWLERCFWGNGPSPRYDSVETEMAEFKKAVA